MSRYERQIPIVGEEGQAGIMGSRVGVAGCGGLGVNALTMLVEAGVADYVVCDPAVPSIADLNTQYIYAAGDKRPKCVICAEWVMALNYTAMVDARSEVIDPETAAVFYGCNLVLDCLEDPAQSRALADWCLSVGVPVVRASVDGNKGRVDVLVPGSPAPEPSGPGSSALGAGVAVVAGVQAGEALRILAGRPAEARTISIDLESWHIEALRAPPACTCPPPG